MNRIVFSFVLAACSDDSNTNAGNSGVSADAADSADLHEVEEDAGSPDTSTPGPNTKQDCVVDEDCTAPTACAIASCVPLPDGNKCMVFARLQPTNFCDDKDPCTIDGCNTEPKTAQDFANFGCYHKPRGCDDGNPCTLNLCKADAPDGCVYPTDVNACNDNSACTQDSCLPGGNCEHVPLSCDDGVASTEDGCTPAGGCYHTPSECAGDGECSDNDPCSVDWCNADQNCIHQPMVCNDGIACTDDSCFGGACMAISNCVGGDACSELACNILSGSCELQLVEQPDGKECTEDSCDPVIGWHYSKIEGCCVKDSDCETGDACLIPVCDTTLNICDSVKKIVDDGNPCTIDACKVGGYIENLPDNSLCTDPKKPLCKVDSGCVACIQSDDCDDNDPCTTDSCDWKTGTCSNETKCEAPKVCNADGEYVWCGFPKGWCNSNEECQYKDSCSKAACIGNACEYTEINCEDGNPCTTDSCDPTYGCQHKWKACDDGNPCTTMDDCNPANGNCEYILDAFCIQCKEDENCSPGPTCVGNSVVDYSGTCHLGQCFHSYPEICASTPCLDGFCEGGACLKKPKSCDDGNACSKDLCDSQQGGCYGIEVDCDDYNPCTKDSCSPTAGCVNDWDYDDCPAGPENKPCGKLWGCAPCKTVGCDDGFEQTSDLCIGPPNHMCVHSVSGLFGGIGIINMGPGKIAVSLKPNNWQPVQNLLLSPGDHLYYGEAVSLIVYSVIDAGTNEDLGIPPYLACLDWNGNLSVGKMEGKTLICD